MAEAEDAPETELPPMGEGDVPPIDFMTFVLSLSTSALAHLGESAHPEAEAKVELALARQTIDLIDLLETKTRGNLDGEEERMLTEILADLKLRYLAKTK